MTLYLFYYAGGTWFESPQAAGGGKVGVIVTWFQVTEVPADANGLRSQISDIAAQKADADGKVLWQSSGVPLEISGSAPNASPRPAVLTGDGSGRAVIPWRNMRQATPDGISLYAQKLDAADKLNSKAGGVRVSEAALNPYGSIINAGNENTIVAYSFQQNGGKRQEPHVQQLNADGRRMSQCP